MRRLLLALVLLTWLAPATAHRASDAFVTVSRDGSQVKGSWEIALRDLEAAITIDRDRDRQITWGELSAARSQLEQRLPPFLTLATDGGPCTLRIDDLQVNQRVDGRYAWLGLAGDCPGDSGPLSVQYRFMFDIDPTHRAILALSDESGAVQTAVLSPSADRFPAGAGASGRFAQFASYVREGVLHIWAGYDHILFMLSLLLPCVLVRESGNWRAVAGGREVLREVLIVVTAFTVAHSVTLSLSVLDVVRLPSRLVESVIALTVLLAALNNVWPLVTRHRAAVALGFGLIHGFGFASALGEVGLPTGARMLGLAGFNVGVELGQLAIVATVMPLLYLLRTTRAYERVVLQAGSLLVAVLAGVWLVERSLTG